MIRRISAHYRDGDTIASQESSVCLNMMGKMKLTYAA